MAENKKPQLSELLKNGQRNPAPKPINPPPQRHAQPQLEQSSDKEYPSIEVDLRELSEPGTKLPSSSFSRIEDSALELNVMTLFSDIVKKDPPLKDVFGDPANIVPLVDDKQNIIINGKIVGKLIDDSEIRVYFNKIWNERIYSKLGLFTSSQVFIASSIGRHVFFSVGRKITTVSYAKSEDGPAVMSV